jgi:hypothetical protein
MQRTAIACYSKLFFKEIEDIGPTPLLSTLDGACVVGERRSSEGVDKPIEETEEG